MVRQRYKWGVVRAIPAGSQLAAPPGAWRKLARPPSVPIEAFRGLLETPITPPNSGSVKLDATGAGTVQVGPSGWGMRWFPTMASVSTTIGPNDVATVTVFAGTKAVAISQPAVSTQGGGDTLGLNDVELHPGLYVIAVWAGGTAGSTATLVVYGRQVAAVN